MEFLKKYEQVTKSRSKLGKYLLAAIESEKQVSIEYVSNNGRKSKRDIIPYGVFKSKQNKFYVSGFCHKAGEERVFSLESLQIVSSDFVTGESFDETLDRYKTQEIPVCATVSCNND